ncbi:MAG: hypothetical protein ABIP94_10620, partial [Planctomycetota bacterium]
TPVIHEAVWQLRGQVSVIAPSGAHYNPVDQSIYVGSRLTAASGGSIVRINPNFSLTPIVGCDRPLGVVVDYATGDVFFSEDYGGNIYRIGFGSNTKQTWVSGFHSGDDDPMGMAIAPANYTGAVVQPGQALVVDHGVNGPKEIWKWDPSVAEGEVLVMPNGGTVSLLDIAITPTGIYFVDAVPAPGRLYQLLSGGAYQLVATSVPLPQVGGVAVDPLNNDLLLRSHDLVLRVNPVTGITSQVVQISPIGDSGIAAGIDISPDGRLMILSYTGANLVYIFERAAQYTTYGAGCSGSNGVPTINAPTLRPMLCTTFAVTATSLPVNAVTFGILGLEAGLANLDPFGMTGCQLLVRNDLILFLSNHPTPTTVLWSVAIPCDPLLEGARFYQQVLATDSTANPFGAILSNAGRAVISHF